MGESKLLVERAHLSRFGLLDLDLKRNRKSK